MCWVALWTSGLVERERLFSVESSDRPIFNREGDLCGYLTGGISFAFFPGNCGTFTGQSLVRGHMGHYGGNKTSSS